MRGLEEGVKSVQTSATCKKLAYVFFIYTFDRVFLFFINPNLQKFKNCFKIVNKERKFHKITFSKVLITKLKITVQLYIFELLVTKVSKHYFKFHIFFENKNSKKIKEILQIFQI